MASHTSLTVVATVATVFGVALTFQVRAGADKVAFPDNYATGVMYLSLDKAESKQVHQIYAMPEWFAAGSQRSADAERDGVHRRALRGAA
jgi:hypothetical protein